MVELSCGHQFLKYILFISNGIFWFCGAIVLGVGIWFKTDQNALRFLHVATEAKGDNFAQGIAITLIVVGTIVFVIGFLGCCGAMRESSFMLLLYSTFIVILMILQIAAGIAAAVLRTRIKHALGRSMMTTVTKRYGEKDNEGITSSYDYMQQTFQCCGAIHGPQDWHNSTWAKTNKKGLYVPMSCCVQQGAKATNETETLCQYFGATFSESSTNITLAAEVIFTQPCKEGLESWVNKNIGIVIGIAIGLAFLQVSAIVIACCLRIAITKQSNYQTV